MLSEMEEGHYLFIVADLKKADLYLFNKGDLEDTKMIMDPIVNKKIKSNTHELYARNKKLEHKRENQIHSHLQLIVSQAKSLLADKHINGIFIGGHKTMFNAIEKELPKDLQEKVRNEFITELNIPQEEIIKHCRQALAEYLKQ